MAVDFDYFCRKLVADGFSVTHDGDGYGNDYATVRCDFHGGGAATASVCAKDGRVYSLQVYELHGYPTPDAICGFMNWLSNTWRDAAGEEFKFADTSNPAAGPECPEKA